VVLFGALFSTLALAVVLRGERRPFLWALAAFIGIAATLAIFFIWTYPANQATVNWTAVPANWEMLRRQWEFSHAVNAVVMFAAFCCVALAVLTQRDRAAARG
jgi:hypothetical protein